MTITDERRSRRERARHWHGMLADDTVVHIADRIHNVLTGRRYTWVDSNAEDGVRAWAPPRVRTSVQLTDDSRPNPRVYRIGDDDLKYSDGPSPTCGLTVMDTGYVWGIHSSHATEGDARRAQRDDQKTWTSVSIEGGLPEDPLHLGRIQIKQFNGPGEMLHWVIAVEETGPGIGEALYELERIDRIAHTSWDDLSAHYQRWWESHPLTDHRHERLYDAVPALVEWLRGLQ